MKKYILFSCVFILFFSCNKIDKDAKVDKNKILGGDYRLFQETPAWNLAKAVWDNNIPQINIEVSKNPKIINFQEVKYGNTLLNLSIYNNDYESFKELLKLGANPNTSDFMHCSSPLINACESFENKIKYVQQLIKYNADVNFVECDNGKNIQKTNRTALILASDRGDLKIVKLLIENGAKINYRNVNNEDALSAAALSKNYNVVLYLLQNGADCKKVLYKKGSGNNLENIYMNDWMENIADHSVIEYSKIAKILTAKGCLNLYPAGASVPLVRK